MSTKELCSEAHLIFAKVLKLPLFKCHSYLNSAIKARFHSLKAVIKQISLELRHGNSHVKTQPFHKYHFKPAMPSCKLCVNLILQNAIKKANS